MKIKSCGDRELVQYVGNDNAGSIFRLLNPPDLFSVAAVCSSWREVVIKQELCKSLCQQIYPDIATFSLVPLLGSADEASDRLRMREEHKIWAYIYLSIVKSPTQTEVNCIKLCIGASSTHNFPKWSMEKTLEPGDQVNLVPFYWSSAGRDDPNLPDFLIYKLSSRLCIIYEIRIKPFEGYSCERLRIRMGHHTKGYSSTNFVTDEDENLRAIADENYVWTYTSPEFYMDKQNVLQSFKLQRPALCIGGVLKIELLRRMQRHIRIYHAQVIGCLLSDTSMADVFGPAR